jgi:cytochrome P450
MSTTLEAGVPDHVPPELVHDFDFRALEAAPLEDPIRYSEILDREGAPDIFFTPRYGGHWVMRRYDDVLAGYQETDHFSARGVNIPPMEDFPILMPQGVDPPEHQRYRRLLNPLFSPTAINRMSNWIREFTADLIDAFADDGECDFVEAFSSRLPTSVFLKLMGMPLSDLPMYLKWEHGMFRGFDEERDAAFANVVGHLAKVFEEKRRHPGDDVPSALLMARDDDGKPFSNSELEGMGLLLFLAGLDTVTNTMSAIWNRLARDTPLRQALVAQPEQRVDDLDELLRVHAMPNLPRGLRKDLNYKGIAMKKGDRMVLLTHRANLDPAHYTDALTTDLSRKPKDILTFGAGPHRCVGSLLARNEIKTALDEWLRRIPDFRIKRGASVDGFAGLVMGYHHLPLEWDRALPR